MFSIRLWEQKDTHLPYWAIQIHAETFDENAPMDGQGESIR